MSEQTSAVVEDGAERHGVRDLASRLYRGEAGVDVVGKRKYFYAVAGIILLIGIITFSFREFNLGIEFKGGNTFTVPAAPAPWRVRAAVTGPAPRWPAQSMAAAPAYGSDRHSTAHPPTGPPRSNRAAEFGIPVRTSASTVSGAWGGRS
jgi:preprotein translocase subunit SecF